MFYQFVQLVVLHGHVFKSAFADLMVSHCDAQFILGIHTSSSSTTKFFNFIF